MQQRVTIFVVCGQAGREIFENPTPFFTQRRFTHEECVKGLRSQLAFHLSYLDVWSMFDSFLRFITPGKKRKEITFESTYVWMIRREELVIRKQGRNIEEKLFRNLMKSAKAQYKRANKESYLIVVREVFGPSDGFNPED